MKSTQVSGTQLFKSKSTENREDGPERMISVSLDRFGGVTEPDDGVYFMTNEQMAEAKEADRLAEVAGVFCRITLHPAIDRRCDAGTG